MKQQQYLCIDLKSFYASVECVERGLDPMTTRLVVADPERSDKTICLAVSPALKAMGVKNRCRVFEIPPGIDYIMAEPRMQKYIDYSAEIYGIYLRYISKDDIHVYSVDEAFLDVSPYLSAYGMTARETGKMLMKEIRKELGIRATCGIGTNLYLTKIALDILAKHAPDFIGELDEGSYRRQLWNHRPLTDFWRIGRKTASKLQNIGIDTMRKLAHTDVDYLYSIFGIDAELLYDHAWGREPVTMQDIKNYRAETTSRTSGQVLMRDYSYEEGKLILKEMVDQLCLQLTKDHQKTASMTVYIGYSNKWPVPPVRGSASLSVPTDSSGRWIPEMIRVYERVVNPAIPIRRFNISCNRLQSAGPCTQLTWENFQEDEEKKDVQIQQVMLDVRKKFGKNAMFRGMDLEEFATTRERNNQIGGHKSGNGVKEPDAQAKRSL